MAPSAPAPMSSGVQAWRSPVGLLEERTRPASSVAKQRVGDGQAAASSALVPMPSKEVGAHGPAAGVSDTRTLPRESMPWPTHSAVPAQAIGPPKPPSTFVCVHAAAPPAGFVVVNTRRFGSPAMQNEAVGQRTLKQSDSPKLSCVLAPAPPSGLLETA